MAQVIPSNLPRKASQGEVRLFAILKRLPQDVIVQYEPLVGNREPDFVVILPSLGVLLIEVKGWYLPDIVGGDTHSIRVREGQHEVMHAHPLRQVREYKFALMDRCKRDPLLSKLVHESGPYAGRFTFPFASLAVLSNITRENLDKIPDRSRAVFPANTVATRDQLLSWEKLDADALLDVLRGYFDTFIFPMTRNQVKIVKAILHPEIVLDLDASTPEPTLKLLDQRQESLARDIGDGHRLVFGVAGSGKTVLLIARAKLISRFRPDAKVLVLCYNVSFCAILVDALEPYSNITVKTFHGWAKKNGASWDKRDHESVVGERLLALLKDGAPDAGYYDAVLIDEAQDFDPKWYPCVLASMKDVINGDLLIVGDGNQGVYKRGAISWKQLGVRAAGRTQYLHQNYRNTHQILTLASGFAVKGGETSEDGMNAPMVDPHQCMRLSGAEVILLTKKSREEEVDRVVRVISDLFRGKWFGEPVQPLRPEQIAVIYRMEHGLIHQLRDKLIKSGCPVLWLTEKGKNAKARIRERSVKILTMHSAKGLQFSAVIVIFANDCPAQFPSGTEEEERSLFYVALTRAEDYLAISCSGSSSFVREINRLGTVGTEVHPRWQDAEGSQADQL